MGCSWISVVSLTVLILASFLANMKAHTEIPETTIQQKGKTANNEEYLSMSSDSTDQPTTYQVATTDASESPKNCSNYSAEKLQSIGDKENVSLTSDCVYLMTTPVPVESNYSSNQSGQVNKILKRTYRDFPEYKQYKTLVKVRPYAVTIPGFITNPLTIIIAMKIKPRHTCELYMIVLGLADLLTVTGKFIYLMIERFADTRYSWDCKVFMYALSVGQVYSNLILLSWTIERFIAVMFPMKLGIWCSVKNTKIILCLLFVFCIGISVPYITENKAITFWNGRTMVNVCNMTEFMNILWVHIESVYFIYVPVIVVAICNLMILYRLNSMTKARISMASSKEIIDKKAQENRRMTILLLSISAIFLFLHIPYIIAIVLGYLYPDLTKLLFEDPHKLSKILLYSNLCITLSEYQNCINFFLYCLSGAKFRTTFRKTFCRCVVAKDLDTEQSSRTNTTKI